MWAALQRRFTDQNRPSTSPELLVRGLKIVPLDGQGSSATWSLGFKEVGSCSRTASLSRDFQSVAQMVDSDAPCYLVLYVGDLHRGSMTGKPMDKDDAAQWVLVAYVPESSTAIQAKRFADNRAGLKAGLGSECFSGDMWCSAKDQITLSHYIKTLDAGADKNKLNNEDADRAAVIQAAYRGRQSRRSSVEMKQNREAAAAAIQRRQRRKSTTTTMGGGLASEGAELSDATAEVWEERIKGVKSAYVDSCVRLGSALEELEQTLCLLTGDEYRADEPMLHSRAHLLKKLEIISSTGQLL